MADINWGMVAVIVGNLVGMVGMYTALRVDLATIVNNQAHTRELILAMQIETSRLRDVCDRRVHRG